MDTLALLLIGYSLFATPLLAAALAVDDAWRGRRAARACGLALLVLVAALQAAHLARLRFGVDAVDTLAYRLALFAIAPAFAGVVRPLLDPRGASSPGPLAWLHLLPFGAVPWLAPEAARALAFLVGTGYLADLGRRLMRLRAERARFAFELAVLALALGAGLAVGVLALLPAVVAPDRFTAAYAAAIGLALLLAQAALVRRPQLSAEVQEVAQAAYATTTLARVDCEAALAALDTAMGEGRAYADPDLGLASLAARVGLSPHQLSELLNARLGKSFARLVREHRVAAARRLLVDEPSASVLSVGLSVGFTSQSTFYEAFREVEGSTPGQWRRLHARAGTAGAQGIPVPE